MPLPGPLLTPAAVATGTEWLVDAFGCRPDALRSIATLEALFARIVSDLGLKAVCPAVWHQFAAPGGVTGVLLLSESHLACHTFPERGFVAFNLYCCRERSDWSWEATLRDQLGARTVTVRHLPRGASAA